MDRRNVPWAALIGIVSALQAWDSGVLEAGGAVIVLAGAGIAAPVLALLFTRSYGAQAASLVVMLVLLTWARLISPVSLNGLHIGLVPASLVIFTVQRRQAKLC